DRSGGEVEGLARPRVLPDVLRVSYGHMKVTGFRSHTYEYQLARKLGDANGPLGSDYGRGSILYIDTDGGVTGIALGGGPVARRLEHLIVGEDPRGVV